MKKVKLSRLHKKVGLRKKDIAHNIGMAKKEVVSLRKNAEKEIKQLRNIIKCMGGKLELVIIVNGKRYIVE